MQYVEQTVDHMTLTEPWQVQSHALVASYALPPHASLSCPPYSICFGATKITPNTRYTFVVLKGGLGNRGSRLVCHSEVVTSRKTQAGKTEGPVRKERQLQGADVVGLDIIPGAGDLPFSIIVQYSDGTVDFVSHDLAQVQEDDTFRAVECSVEYTACVDADTARKGLLKGREDVAQVLARGSAPAMKGCLLCRVTRSEQDRYFQLYAVQDPGQHTNKTSNTAIRLLISYMLPSKRRLGMSVPNFDLHSRSGMLYQLQDQQLSVYDLTGTTPRLALEIGTQSSPVSSFSRLSASRIMAVSYDAATILESAYGSVSASISLLAPARVESRGAKRKREQSADEPRPVSLITSFGDIGLVVGLSGEELLAFQLDSSLEASKRSRTPKTLLVDVLGRAASRESYGLARNENQAKKWTEWTAAVDALVAADDVAALESFVAQDAQLGRQRKPKKSGEHGRTTANGMFDGDVQLYEDLWPLPEPLDPDRLDRRKVLYILAVVFDCGQTRDCSLEIQIRSTKLLEWLALAGALNVSSMRHAFARQSGKGARLKSGDVMKALARMDDDFQLIHDLLLLPVHWDVAEVTEALRIVVRSFDTPVENDMLALPAREQPSSDIKSPSNEIESDPDVESETEAAQQELDRAFTALSAGLENRSDALRVILGRLNTYPHKTIVSTMRSMMEQSELVFFIHMLRMELADGGWTSRYIDADAEVEDERLLSSTVGAEECRHNDRAMQIIGDLLNCAVDAIGVTGWLVGQSGAEIGAEEIITSLKAEVGAGLEGCHEASNVSVLLGEMERCAAQAREAQAQDANSLQKFEHIDENEMVSGKTLLPLGPRSGPLASTRKQNSGQKKSRMEVGREKSRAVGKYSFERIRI